jgi:putative hydrolase of the HAD superfamily
MQAVGSTNFDAVLFDFGGVIADGPFEAFSRYEAENGLPDGFVRSLNASNHDANAWARLERGEVSFDEFCVLFEKEAVDAGGQLDARTIMLSLSGDMRPAMLEAIRRLRAHFRTALLTNNFVKIDRDDRFEPLADLFDIVVESAVEGLRKPDPRFYLLACERLGVEPARSVFLDDLGVNLKSARALGMTTIKVTDPDQALADLEDLVGIDLRGPTVQEDSPV